MIMIMTAVASRGYMQPVQQFWSSGLSQLNHLFSFSQLGSSFESLEFFPYYYLKISVTSSSEASKRLATSPQIAALKISSFIFASMWLTSPCDLAAIGGRYVCRYSIIARHELP
jgi:hypothetical protein